MIQQQRTRQRAYFVLVTPDIGGAEKRFFDVFTAMRRAGSDVMLIGPSGLLAKLRSEYADRDDVLAATIGVPLAPYTPLSFMKGFFALLRTLPRGSSFHYPLNCLWPLHLGRGDRVTMSVVDSARVPKLFGTTRTNRWTWLAMQFSPRIDVLNPAHIEAMKGYRAAPRMSLTPGGTFLIPPAAVEVPREPAVVFMGRLVPLKGLDDYLDVLPGVWRELRRDAPPGLSFDFAGYGPLEEHLRSRVAELQLQGVPVRFLGYAQASTLLAKSAVLVSMQERSNFPSRGVAEALIAGCGVVVRDTGDSRAFGTDVPGLMYCGGVLDAVEVAGRVRALLAEAADAGWRREVGAAAMKRFSSTEYLDYFSAVMDI